MPADRPPAFPWNSRLRDRRVAVLLHDGVLGVGGKTGLAFLRYGDATVVAAIDRATAGGDLQALTGIPRPTPIVASVEAALAYDPDTLLVGLAPSGGRLPPDLRAEVDRAIAAGLSAVNGLHDALGDDPDLQRRLQPGQWIWDLRREPDGLAIAAGRARELGNRRVLAVGTDMAVGKMSVSLELCRAAIARGLRAKFLATGQAGLAIAGDGVPLDAVRVDFAAGAVEKAVLEFGRDRELVFVEGQGSLFHPGSTATLPLLRGSQPTHLVLVHRAGQTHIDKMPHAPIPPLPAAIAVCETLAAAGGTFAPAPVAAVALNTAKLDEPAARAAIARVEAETGRPCTDPIRYGPDPILDAILAVPIPPLP